MTASSCASGTLNAGRLPAPHKWREWRNASATLRLHRARGIAAHAATDGAPQLADRHKGVLRLASSRARAHACAAWMRSGWPRAAWPCCGASTAATMPPPGPSNTPGELLSAVEALRREVDSLEAELRQASETGGAPALPLVPQLQPPRALPHIWGCQLTACHTSSEWRGFIRAPCAAPDHIPPRLTLA